jgi:hypothetical protein
MRKGRLKAVVVAIALVALAVAPLVAVASETVTIEGEINDSFQIVDSNGQIYEIADTAEGDTLVQNHVGEKAKVTGTLEQDQDVKIIKVSNFELLAE